MYCLVSEKPLRLFIPLIFSGGIWSACGEYLAISDIFYESIIIDEFLKM